MKGAAVEEQIQWILSYTQGLLVDVWKENLLKDLETEEVEFLLGLRKEFGGGDKEAVKEVELKRVEQGEKTMEEIVQEFKKAARGSRYKGRVG